MKIATWNVNSLSVRLPQVLAWLATNPVDALCLQELKLTDDKFPHAALQDAGYHAVAFGQKTYNGVAILTRTPVRDVVRNIPGFDDEQSRVIAATLDTPEGPLRLLNGYFVNGQEPGSEKFAYKMRWLDALRGWLCDELTRHPQLVLLGDFNAYAEEDPMRWLKANGWTDAFAQAGAEAPYSFVYDGQSGRLDHALLDAGLAGRLRGAAEWHNNADEAALHDYRRGEPGPWRASDHDPLLLGLDLAD